MGHVGPCKKTWLGTPNLGLLLLGRRPIHIEPRLIATPFGLRCFLHASSRPEPDCLNSIGIPLKGGVMAVAVVNTRTLGALLDNGQRKGQASSFPAPDESAEERPSSKVPRE